MMNKHFSRFALGMRVVDAPGHRTPPDDFLNMLFASLSPSEACDLDVYVSGTPDDVFDPEPVYIVVLANMSIKRSKRLYQQRILHNMLLRSHLTVYRPFVQNNYLNKCEHIRYVGRAASDGAVLGGEIAFGGMRFCAPVPKETLTIRLGFMLAPCSYPGLTPAQAGRCLTRAVASRFPDAIVDAYPLAAYGVGMLDAFIFHRGGRYVPCTVHDQSGNSIETQYGILSDYSAVIETSKARANADAPGEEGMGGSYGVGELFLHALIAKCRRIYLCVDSEVFSDCGEGFMRALGMQMETDGDRILVDAPRVHPNLKETTVIILSDAQKDGKDTSGLSQKFAPFARVEEASAVETLLQQGSFDRRVREMALVISGIGRNLTAGQEADNVMKRIGAHCRKGLKQLVEVPMPVSYELADAEALFEQSAFDTISRMTFENWFIQLTSELVPVSGDKRIGRR